MHECLSDRRPSAPPRAVTASIENGASASRTVDACTGSSPSTRRSGCVRSRLSSRYVITSIAGREPILRASSRTTSSVASSAQCRSSITRSTGVRLRRSTSLSVAKNSAGAAPSATRAANDRPTASAMSRNGPSGRGVKSASHPPHQATTPWRSQNACTSDVFPMPASPETSTIAPAPDVRTVASAASSAADSTDRSSSSIRCMFALRASDVTVKAGRSAGDCARTSTRHPSPVTSASALADCTAVHTVRMWGRGAESLRRAPQGGWGSLPLGAAPFHIASTTLPQNGLGMRFFAEASDFLTASRAVPPGETSADSWAMIMHRAQLRRTLGPWRALLLCRCAGDPGVGSRQETCAGGSSTRVHPRSRTPYGDPGLDWHDDVVGRRRPHSIHRRDRTRRLARICRSAPTRSQPLVDGSTLDPNPQLGGLLRLRLHTAARSERSSSRHDVIFGRLRLRPRSGPEKAKRPR